MVKTSDDALGDDGGNRTVMNPPPPIPDLFGQTFEQRVASRRWLHSREHVDDTDAECRAYRRVHCISSSFQDVDANLRANLVLASHSAVFRFHQVRFIPCAREVFAGRWAARGSTMEKCGMRDVENSAEQDANECERP